MGLNHNLLFKLEENLKPHDLSSSAVPITVLGYGDISLVFKIDESEGMVLKRIPAFKSRTEAEQYAVIYKEYSTLLAQAGLNIPETDTAVIDIPGRAIAVLYIAQQILPSGNFAHALIHTFSDNENKQLLARIVREISKIWEFNHKNTQGLELALDSQLSNWVLRNDSLYYVDTSTPLFRKNGIEQILGNVDAFLECVPAGLRWIFRRVFVNDVIPRYYIRRNVFIDFLSNLNNERPDIIPMSIEIVNGFLGEQAEKITAEEVVKYYAEDRRFWLIFLALRRLDRWIKIKILRKRYEFTLPEKSSFSK
jgi:hypothetical protein